MNYNVSVTERFKKDTKRLTKKYASLKADLLQLVEGLQETPIQGDSLGKSCYKIRLKVASKRRGKSGGARVITYVHIIQEDVYLLTIYDKSEKEDLNPDELEELLRELA